MHASMASFVYVAEYACCHYHTCACVYLCPVVRCVHSIQHMGGNFLYELNDGLCVHFHATYIKYMSFGEGFLCHGLVSQATLKLAG